MTPKGPVGSPNPNMPPKKGPKFNIYWIYGLFLLALIALNFWGKDFTHNVKEESFQSINSRFISKNWVDSMVVYGKSVDVFLDKDSLKLPVNSTLLKSLNNNLKGPQYSFTIGNVEQFRDDMTEAQKNAKFESKLKIECAIFLNFRF